MEIASTLELINDQQITERKQVVVDNCVTLKLKKSSRHTYLIFLFSILELILYILAFVLLPQPCVNTLMKELFIMIIATNSMKFFLIIHLLSIIEYHKIDINKDERSRRSKIPYSMLVYTNDMEELILDYYCSYKIAKYLYVSYKMWLYIYSLELIVFVFGQAVIYESLDSECEFGKSEFNFTWGVAITYLILRYIFLGIPLILLLIAGLLSSILLCFFVINKEQIFGQQRRKEKIQIYNERMVGLRQISEDNICVICQDKFYNGEQFIRLNCYREHVFHKVCVSVWFKFRLSCPICRKMQFWMINKQINSDIQI